jgi:hypothetical protein
MTFNRSFCASFLDHGGIAYELKDVAEALLNREEDGTAGKVCSIPERLLKWSPRKAGLCPAPFILLPALLEIADAAGFLRKVIDELKTTSRSSSPLRLGEDMIAKTVCRHAVKANDPLRYPEIEKLIRDLLACDLPYCCPHGRPTMIQISHAELEKKFGRKV